MSLEFNEKKHEYKSNGIKLTSVTKLIHKYTNVFDKELIIDRMFQASPTQDIYLGKTRKYIGMTREQISETWKINQVSKSAYGTRIHELAEDIGNGIEVDIKMPEINQIKKFFKKEGYEIVKQELRIYNEDLQVAGTVDLLLKKDDLYYIGDWKTNCGKDLEARDDRFMKYCKEPIQNTPDLKFWNYALQMSIYRYLYELKHTDIKFGGQFLIHLIGSQDDLKDKNGKRVVYPDMNRITYRKIETPYMKGETIAILMDNKNEK